MYVLARRRPSADSAIGWWNPGVSEVPSGSPRRVKRMIVPDRADPASDCDTSTPVVETENCPTSLASTRGSPAGRILVASNGSAIRAPSLTNRRRPAAYTGFAPAIRFPDRSSAADSDQPGVFAVDDGHRRVGGDHLVPCGLQF